MPLVSEGNYYTGFVEAGGRKYFFSLTLSPKPQDSQTESSSGSRGYFEVDWRLYNELGDSLKKFCEEKEFLDPRDFYNQLSEVIKKNAKPYETKSWYKNALKIGALAKSLAQEMDDIEEYLTSIDLETRTVGIEVTDSQLRNHKAVIELSLNYRSDPVKVVSHDLPIQKSGVYSAPELNDIFTVTEFCEKFSELVNCFQQFWNMIALVDSECWVLDPQSPSFKDVNRRIKLCDTVSISLIFNPYCANQRPQIKLLGCQSDVNYYESILQKNLENDIWDYEENLLFNLSNVLETSVPSKVFDEDPGSLDLNGAGECAICFTRELNNVIPDEMCENPTCKSLYHSTCLFTYLSSVPRNRDYFGKIQGDCPNCNDIISCAVPKCV